MLRHKVKGVICGYHRSSEKRSHLLGKNRHILRGTCACVNIKTIMQKSEPVRMGGGRAIRMEKLWFVSFISFIFNKCHIRQATPVKAIWCLLSRCISLCVFVAV